VVTNIDSSGQAIGLLAEGPPNRFTENKDPSWYGYFKGLINSEGLNFELDTKYSFKMLGGGEMLGTVQGRKGKATIMIEQID
jgi:hypothetical protein